MCEWPSSAPASPASAWRSGCKQAGIDDFVVLERGRRRRRHLARQHLSRLRLRRALAPLLVLLRAQPRLDAAPSRPSPRSGPTCARCAERFGVTPHIRFGHELLDAALGRGRQPLARSRPQRRVHRATSLVAGDGPLSEPSIPDIPGLEQLRRHGLPLGALGPRPRSHRQARRRDRHRRLGDPVRARRSSREVEQLHLFQRTPPWIIPRHDRAAHRLRARLLPPRPGRPAARAAPASTGRARASCSASLPPAADALAPSGSRCATCTAQVADPELRAKLTPQLPWAASAS